MQSVTRPTRAATPAFGWPQSSNFLDFLVISGNDFNRLASYRPDESPGGPVSGQELAFPANHATVFPSRAMDRPRKVALSPGQALMSPGIEVSKRVFLINSVSSVGAKLLNISVLVWLQQHLLRRIPPEEYAIYPVVASVMFLLPLFSSFLSNAVTRYLIDAYARHDERRVTQLVSSIFPLLLGVSVTLTAIGFLFAWYIDRVLTIAPAYRNEARLMLALLVLQFTSSITTVPFVAGFQLRQRYMLRNMLQLSQQLLRLLFLVILLMGVSTRVSWVVVATFAASIPVNTIMVILSRRMVPALVFRLSSYRWSMTRELMSFGLWQVGGQISYFLYNSQSILLNKFGSAVDVTAFYVGNMIDINFREVLDTAAEPIQPTLAVFYARNDQKSMGEAYLRGGRYMMWMAMAAAGPLIIFSKEFINVYIGSKYQDAAWVLTLLLLAYPFCFSNRLLGRLALATGQIRLMTIASLIKESFNLGLSFYLVWGWRLGAIGSAIGVLSANVLGYLFFYWPLGLRIGKVSLSQFMSQTVWLGMYPTFGGALVWFPLKYLIHPDGWFKLGFCVSVGYVAYLGVVIRCMQPYERQDLTTIWDRIRTYMQLQRAV